MFTTQSSDMSDFRGQKIRVGIPVRARVDECVRGFPNGTFVRFFTSVIKILPAPILLPIAPLIIVQMVKCYQPMVPFGSLFGET